MDVDTLKVRHMEGPALPSRTIRLIGVDTPEVHGEVEPYGPEASRFAKRQLEGKTIWLTKDVSETDQYGRALRYVWLQKPSSEPTPREVRRWMFNGRLIMAGYALLVSHPPDVKYHEVLREFQLEAIENRRGFWGIQAESTAESPDERESSVGTRSGYGGL